MTILLLLAGLVILTVGADVLVRGAATLARRFGFSPLLVGLTVVAFGTSAPEMAVSAKAALLGQPGIAVGNVVGSNIFNVLFILGLSALIVPLVVSSQLVRLDVPVMIAASALAWWMMSDGMITRPEAVILFVAVVAYTGVLVFLGMRQSGAASGEAAAEGTPPRTAGGIFRDLALVAGGLVMLVIGARLLVNSAVEIAGWFGVSDLVIGLTIVAAGTSLPEVAASVMASIKGERDIAIGNVVGSNIFNLLAVLGIAGIIAPSGIPVAAEALAFDLPIMVAVALVCLPIFFSGLAISRLEGGFLFACYVAYVVAVVLIAQSPTPAHLQAGLLAWGLPVAALGIIVLTFVDRHGRPDAASPAPAKGPGV